MKFFTYLMSAYLLLLSCMPCNDSSDCSAEDTVSMIKPDGHDDHNAAAEYCTPFCVCACCAAPVVTFQQAFGLKRIITGRTINMCAADFVFSETEHNIWQPPRC